MSICVICDFWFCVSVSSAADINTPTGMAAYLKSKQLPPLKSIDLWDSQFGTGLKLTTAHYEIYTTLLEPLMLSQVPGFVESAYHGYQSQLPQPIDTSAPFTVYLFANRQQWEDFTRISPARRPRCISKSKPAHITSTAPASRITSASNEPSPVWATRAGTSSTRGSSNTACRAGSTKASLCSSK